MQGKNAIIKSSQVIESQTFEYPPPVSCLNLREQIDNVVGLAEIVLNVVVLSRNPQLDELVLESSRLLEEAVHLATYRHTVFSIKLK